MSENKIKSVTFNKIIDVILIPTRHEYIEEELDYYIWWNAKDLYKMKLLAISELRTIMALQNISYNEAKNKLYQPQETTIFKCTEPINSDLWTYHNQPIS